MPGVYFLSTTGDITFILPKLDLKKSIKKTIKLFKLYLLHYVENWATFHLFFHLSFPKVLYKSVLLSIVKVPFESDPLSFITCRHLLAYHTENYFIKVFYLSSKNAESNVTYHCQKRILSVLCYVKFLLGMWNKEED